MDTELIDFAEFLARRLTRLGQGEYLWEFQLTDPPDWVPHGWSVGDNLDESTRLLNLAAARLRAALNRKDAECVRECVRVIMDWGGRWCTQPRAQGNETAVNAMRDDHLLDLLDAGLQAFAAGELRNFPYINAGWTKVFATLAVEPPLVMYDSRVSKTLAKNVLQWERETGSGPSPVRELLEVTERAVRPTEAPDYPVCTPRDWAKSMWHASQVVAAMPGICRSNPQLTGSWLASAPSRIIEARLFMLGK